MLGDEQVAQCEQDGFLIVEDLLSKPELETIRRRIVDIVEGRTDFPEEHLEFEPNADRTRHLDNFRKLNNCAEHDQVFLDHARNPGILSVVESLLGPDIKLMGDQFFLKPPGGIEKTYHQDSPYFSIEPMDLVSSWAAIDDVTLDNGCMWVVPGSHKGGPLEHSQAWMVGDRKDMCVPDSAFDRSKEVPITMKAGSVSFHHSLLLHRSGPNNTPNRRRGLASHYMSAKSRWTGPPEEKPDYPLMRGREFPGCV